MSEYDSRNYNLQDADPKNAQDLAVFIQLTLQQMQSQFQATSEQITNRIDDMGNRIDDLENNIAGLINQSGGQTVQR